MHQQMNRLELLASNLFSWLCKIKGYHVCWLLWLIYSTLVELLWIFSGPDCQGIGIHWKERRASTSFWIFCSYSWKIKQELKESYIVSRNLSCSTVECYYSSYSSSIFFSSSFSYVHHVDVAEFLIAFLSVCHWHGCRYPFTSNQIIPSMDWEEYVSEIASDIMKEQSPKRFFYILQYCLYFSIVHC